MATVLCSLVADSLPIFLEVVGRLHQLDARQLGFVAMADLGGFACAVLACALRPAVTARLTWRGTMVLGALVLAGANLASAGAGAFPLFLATRFGAGFGNGMVTAITYALIAEGNGARLMAILTISTLASGAIAVPYLMPLADGHGAVGFFGLFAGLGVLSTLLAPLIPAGPAVSGAGGAADAVAAQAVSPRGWLAVLSVFVHFCGFGAMFAFIYSMGVAWGSTPASVENAVSQLMYAGAVAVTLVAIIGTRFGATRSYKAAYLALLAASAVLLFAQPREGFLVACLCYGFTSNFLLPYQFEVVTRIDQSSGAAMLISAGMFAGIACGPAVAGYLVTPGYGLVIAACIATFAGALGLMLVAEAWQRREARPPASDKPAGSLQ